MIVDSEIVKTQMSASRCVYRFPAGVASVGVRVIDDSKTIPDNTVILITVNQTEFKFRARNDKRVLQSDGFTYRMGMLET